MAKSKIIPSRAVSNRNIGGSSISPGETISGKTNDQKVIVEGSIYDGGETSTAIVTVDNVEHKIYAQVKKFPAHLRIRQSDGTYILFDGSKIETISINDYTIKEVNHQSNEVKRYQLLQNGNTPVGDDIIIPKEEVSYEVREDKFTSFIFEDNTEVSYKCTIDTDIELDVPKDIAQGFISLLTIDNMEDDKVITVNNYSSLPLRIVKNNIYYSGNTFTTRVSGKKIIFARCDGINVEILIIEEQADDR